MRDSSKLHCATRYVDAIVAEHRGRQSRPGLRSCAVAPQESHDPPLSVLEQCNVQAKAAFRSRVREVLGKMSIREQAKFFDVPHSTYNERISDRRTDLAPLAAWSERVENYADFLRLSAEFLRTA